MTLASKCAIGCCSVVGASASTVAAVKLSSSKSNTVETETLEETTTDIEIPLTPLTPAAPIVNASSSVPEVSESEESSEILPEVKTEEIQNTDLKKIIDWARENGGCKIVIKKADKVEEEVSENTEDLPGLFSEIDKYKSTCKLANGVRGKAENPNMLFERENGSWIAAREEGE